MAWRLHEHVIRGEIDNRIRGRVTGCIWLAGVEAPLRLELSGDCHPDLAGCRITFENPSPIPLTTRPPTVQQSGSVGNITAARKVRVFDVPFEEAYAMLNRDETPPEHLANALYVEWFNPRSGRVVIESADYRLQVSEPEWRLSAEEIAEWNRRTSNADSPFAITVGADGSEEVWDEFRCEQLLRESELTSDQYGRLLEKYGDYPDCDAIIAREMGWTHFEKSPQAPEPDFSSEFNELEDDEDFEIEPDRTLHPLAQRARDLLDPWLTDLQSRPGWNEGAVGDWVGQLMILRVKLSAHLSFLIRKTDFLDSPLLIAWLKRDLELTNQTLAALEPLIGHPEITPERLSKNRAELFAIREGLLAIIAELRG